MASLFNHEFDRLWVLAWRAYQPRYRVAESEPEKDERDQGEDRRYQPGDHPKTVLAAAERNAADVHAPNARDQGRRQENHREHREYVKVSVGFLFNLRPQQELA